MRRRKGKKKIRTGRNLTRREKLTQRNMHLSDVCILWSRMCIHAFSPVFICSLTKSFIHSIIYLFIGSFIGFYRPFLQAVRYSLFLEFSAHWVEPTKIWDRREKKNCSIILIFFENLFLYFICMY